MTLMLRAIVDLAFYWPGTTYFPTPLLVVDPIAILYHPVPTTQAGIEPVTNTNLIKALRYMSCVLYDFGNYELETQIFRRSVLIGTLHIVRTANT